MTWGLWRWIWRPSVFFICSVAGMVNDFGCWDGFLRAWSRLTGGSGFVEEGRSDGVEMIIDPGE